MELPVLMISNLLYKLQPNLPPPHGVHVDKNAKQGKWYLSWQDENGWVIDNSIMGG